MQTNTRIPAVVEYGKEIPWQKPQWSDDAELIYFSEFPFLPFRANQPIFRYMELWKFEDLVKSGRLHFPRADQFKIQLEGGLPNSEILGLAEREIAHHLSSKNYRAKHKSADEHRRKLKSLNFVSCWHMIDDGDPKVRDPRANSPESIYVFTTVGRLLRSMHPYVIASPVRYETNGKPGEKFTPINFLFHNDQPCHVEKEFRLLTNSHLLEPFVELKHQDDSSVRLPLDLPDVIISVILLPNAPKELRTRVENLVEEFLPGVRLSM